MYGERDEREVRVGCVWGGGGYIPQIGELYGADLSKLLTALRSLILSLVLACLLCRV